MGRELKTRQISCAPRYIQKPAFMCKIFQEQKTFGKSRFPFTLARPEALHYDPERFPLTMQALQNILVLPWNENYSEEHVNYISDAIHDSISNATQLSENERSCDSASWAPARWRRHTAGARALRRGQTSRGRGQPRRGCRENRGTNALPQL